MKVVLVKVNGVAYSIGSGENCFPIKNNIVQHEDNQRIGAEIKGKSQDYNNAFELASFAWKAQEFDAIEEH